MLLNFDRLGWWKYVLVGITLLTAAFLLLPIVFIAALSFGSSQWLIFPPPGWTFQWYGELFADPRWLESALTSFKIAVIVTILSVLLGLVTSFGLVRGSFLFCDALKALFLTPMILPVVVLAVALYAFFLRIGLGGTLTGFVISHLVLALPFSILSISSALEGFDKSIEDAAVLCGASPLEAKIRVTLPAIGHGLFSAAVFSFLTSWDEVVVAIFMSSPTLQTLPVKVWATLRQDLTPVVAAASTLLILLTIILMALVAVVRKVLKQ
ncbi:putative spermidine/putrescine transport system permease protein [Rhizobium leguminosarum]|uniref:Spermidine/putrescine transport system permease protein n=1 Tax=Rhizobium leguminosarum TaxID=384 RepID=A0AAE2MRW0_RHILE|nr:MULTISPECIES: ABC transporter permease [Rhizobium]MBB4294204.1 putative spermidine/putrescine transport system permease protein [Rhizobium leguminosarum]MBB4300700.1 putative spermidine/putrescine transport system permease protein [Rhizobium leguminosarum]MBB4311988.1 putative spermidine/putrescine transport system permease protein [Rhizobium leguminosarum]MBB4421042.1 putative spermidine/putrescine transport system permease protein [Rhizobium leguminosarum]MBB4436230.1 putative spermidine/